MSGVARWTAALAWLTHPVYVVAGMPMSWGDIAGFLTGIVNVWLAARAHVWNFHLGIANAAILGLVFLQQRLFADASLQVVFIVLNLRGLLQWRAGHTVRESDPVFRLRHGEHAMLVVVAAALWLPLWWVLGLLKGSAPPIDAAITSLSIVAQWLLNRRVLENWAWWIVIDLISDPLNLSPGHPLISALYFVFLALSVQGFLSWRRHVVPQPEAAAA